MEYVERYTIFCQMKELFFLNQRLFEQNVLVVEDIIDTGRTIVKLLDILEKYQPKTVKVCR